MARTEEQLAEFAGQVAREAWKSLNQAYRDYRDEECARNDDSAMEDCEVYLYVYADGNWTIDGAQYLQDHRNIVASIPLQQVNGPIELAEAIAQEYDDDGCVLEYTYQIDLDERGEFRAHVDDQDGRTIFTIDGFEIFEDGFMKHKQDTVGLHEYLTSLGLMPRDSAVLL